MPSHTDNNESPLKKLREEAGLSQQELASRIGVAISTLSRWERGQTPFVLTVRQIQLLCRLLNKDPDNLDINWFRVRLSRNESPIVKLRSLRRFTQKELADALGVSEQTVSNWEVGRSEPKLSPRQYKTLLRILRITPEQLPDDFGPQEDIEQISPLKRLREASGLTQADLASQLIVENEAISEETIRDWERAESQPLLSLLQLKALCRVLGVSLDELADSLERSSG